MPAKKLSQKQLLRVVDANYNRVKEGLRVCEDTARFVWNARALAAQCKQVRHDVTAAISACGLKEIIVARNIAGDVGRATTGSESRRFSVGDIFYANAQRVKESLRVLEEFAKLVDINAAEKLKRSRYSFYDLEKKAISRL